MFHDYNQHRPYRDTIIEYQKTVGMTEFTSQRQFWTLGGPCHNEFIELNKHLKFGPESYHTVENAQEMIPTNGIRNSRAIVTYPNTDFNTSYDKWGSVGVISYDSTETILALSKHRGYVDQSRKIINLAQLARIALQNSEEVFVHSNWMIGFANFSDPREEPRKSELKKAYKKWVRLFDQRFKTRWFDASIELMETSQTFMIGLHCLVKR